ncbi:TPA: signal recognition particle-docking protein FtsY [Salmonella enterica]|uniref:Signal recognition particle receptor FtsY n=1 Tax=Salmonella enterica TaxID=28901 RepID=A0A701ZAA0_SALER|nr:signal recognition particle-docking protein FtsY [Salmonella enterica]EBH9037311.1 signal recognition particle-docking protein FtsY [Salmonella enterica subsp. indica serovar 11:b:e,n,x]EEJ9030554.1 signal recognition particle-docking protein FtsY [Salmonella enterica subsp. enterica serovar Oslo]HAC6573199.1 signal recognition particle-docking protein FtsY [Salmonella enterica subsp. indica]HBC0060559.1 signal recognition particle-docking protein FtsY [Salmonella enterica]HBC0141884.1 sign
MAKQKKRGFFSWLGFGDKEQKQEQTEEQQIVEEQRPVEPPVETAADIDAQTPAHSKAETEAFAEEVVDVTEKVQESEKPQPVEPDPAAAVETAAPQIAVEREELPLPEEVKDEAISPEEWQAEAETVEVITAVEEEGENAAKFTDEELEAQALAAQAAEEAVMVVPAAEEDAPVEAIVQEQEKPTKEGFFARLKRSLLKTKENLGSGFISLFRGKKIDDDLFEELEEQLLIADVGVETTRKIIANLTEGASRKQLKDAEALYGLLKDEMGEILAKVDEPLNIEGKTPFVILMVGVNGVGKTTTIGKLARQFEQQGKSVMLAAGDTFRAAAVEQLQVWGQRNNIPVIAQHTGADSASVIFDAIQAAKARNVDVLIADTAGRLQNKSHLMEELKKIVRVMKKLDEDAPHEVMLTIDASTGQNAVSQAKLFHEAVGLTGITLTKLDGTAKGGVIFSVADQFGIPIRYIGVGERIEDLRPFKADDFIEALFARED